MTVSYVSDGARVFAMDEGRRSLPVVIDPGLDWNQPATQYEAQAMTLLLDWFGEEEHAERKARALAPFVAARITTYGPEWTMPDDALCDLVAEVLTRSAGPSEGVEYLGGERRGHVARHKITRQTDEIN